MPNSLLPAYWKWKINKASEIEKFGLSFRFRKIYKKEKWEIQVVTQKGVKVYSHFFFGENPTTIAAEAGNACTEIMREQIYNPSGKLRKFFDNQYKLWL